MYVENPKIHLRNPKKTKNKNPGRTKWISKPVGYKINIEISIAFLYISNKQLQNKIKRITIYSNFKNP